MAPSASANSCFPSLSKPPKARCVVGRYSRDGGAMDRLSAMVIFARVVEEQSFSAAARRLGLAKATVSKEIARLEDHLGVRLLNRSTRRIALTDVGLGFYERCAKIADDVDAAERAVGTFQERPKGHLRITAPVSYVNAYLAGRLPDFLAQFPDITIDLACSDHFVDLLNEGFDVAIRIARLPDSSLIARRIAPSRMHAIASAKYIETHGHPVSLADLSEHNCLTYSYQTTGADSWEFIGVEGPISVRVTGNLRANNGDALLAAVHAGLGIAVLPAFICGDDVARGRVVDLFPEHTETQASIWAVHTDNRHVPAKVRAFIDWLAAAPPS